ncbi:hypothetical protein K438DRAFT_1964311 [Mycena galopus ATCC 62051]|nr:hypothetical protein K438DRAFT_1964311 [Mycena galopus ATCC 62051]
MSSHHHIDCDPPDYATDAGDDWAPSGSPDATPPILQHRTGPSAFEPRYVYYSVYAPEGMLRWLKNSQENPFVGRIKATSVPPPHTIASLKRALVQAEGLPDSIGDLTALFQTRDSRTPLATTARVNIFNGDVGATAKTPMALVFLRNPKESLQVVSENDVKDYLGNELSPLYYRLYSRGGEASSSRPLDPGEPALGCIKRELISPPRNTLCVKRRIGKVEGKPIYQFADLFTDVRADNAHPSAALVYDAEGSVQEHPILIVQPERRPGLYNRPVLIVALPPGVQDPGYRPWNSRWLYPAVDDILRTDGVARTEKDPELKYVYTAVDTSGRTGCEC